MLIDDRLTPLFLFAAVGAPQTSRLLFRCIDGRARHEEARYDTAAVATYSNTV